MKILLVVVKFFCFLGYFKVVIVIFIGFLILWSMIDIVFFMLRWKMFGVVIKIWVELKEWRWLVIWFNICYGLFRLEIIIVMR